MRIPALIICIVLFTCCHRKDPLPKTGLEGKILPAVNVLSSDSTTYFNTSNIPAGQPIVLLLFDPYCPYCREETKSIITNIKSMQDVRFYLITSSSFSDMKAFYKNFELNKYKNITVGVDTGFSFIKYFKISGVPFTAIYTRKKTLKQTFSGNVEAKVINDIIKS